MRLTSQEWIERLQQVLGSPSPSSPTGQLPQPVRSAVPPWVVDEGSDNRQLVPAQSRAFQGLGGAEYFQVHPSGMYDTVLVTVQQVEGPSSHLYPLFVAFKSLRSAEGRASITGGTEAFFRSNPPAFLAPAATNGNRLEVEVPPTNAPLVVWALDAINPTSSVEILVSVSLLSRRG